MKNERKGPWNGREKGGLPKSRVGVLYFARITCMRRARPGGEELRKPTVGFSASALLGILDIQLK